MSREVDERVVEMQFDNKQFESGVAQTINSLDKLTNALKFEGIGNSIRGIQNGINQMDFSPITSGVGALESTLTSLGGRIKLEVFDGLSKYAVDTGEKIFKALTIQGARAGFAEYETQQGAVQTILANTQHLGTTITDVNAALNDLNEYADLTIYNFTEMTRNIGTFTAAGLDLQTSTSAIKGIANLAAVSGSTSEQASRAMYQLSQALAAGRVNLMDWNSVVNAGMGGKVFQDALKRTAKHMGIVVDESKSFRESISGGDTWLTADVLSETLKQLSGDMDEQTLAAQGWSQAEIEEITKMAKTATDAATVVKTFSQLTSTVSEQIGSGWTKTWQLIFGDFEESKSLWTGVYKAISPYIDAMSDLRNTHLQFWKENEGREKIIQAFSNLWSGASDFIDRFTTSFRKAFPIVDTFGQTLTDISDRFLKFSERFKVVKEKTDQVTEAFDKVSDAIGKITAEDKKNALDIWNWGNINGNPGRIDGQARVEALGESYDRVQKYINTFIATGYDVAKTDELLGVGAEEANKAISKTADINARATTAEEKRDIVLTNLVQTMRHLADIAKIIGGSLLKTAKAAGAAFKDVFDPLMATGDLEKSTSVLEKVARAFEITAAKAEDVKRIFRGVFAAFDILYQLVRSVASAIAKALVPSLGSVDKASGGLLKVLGNFGDWVYALDQAIKEGDLFSVAIEKMISFITSLDDKVIDVVHSFESWSGIDFGKVVSKISGAITKGLDKFKEWTGVDIAAIFESIWERIKTFVGYLKAGDFSGAFTYVADGVKGFVSTIIETLKNLDFKTILDKIGSMFGDLGQWIGEVFDKIFGKSEETAANAAESAKKSFSLLDVLGAIIYGGYTVIKEAITWLYGIFTGEKAQQLGSAIKEFFTGLFSKTSEDASEQKSGMEKFKDFMKDLGEALSTFYEKVKPIIGAGFIGGFIKIFSDISTASKNFSKAPLVLNETMKTLAKSFDNMSKSFKIETLSRFIKTLADSIIKLVMAIAAIMVLNKMEGGVAGATAVITTLIIELMGALTFAQKKLDTKLNMAFMAQMLKSLANTMLKMVLSLLIISKIGDNQKIGGALLAFTVIMSELDGTMLIMADIIKSKQFRRGGENLVLLSGLMDQLGKTMIVMATALYILGKVDPDRMGTAIMGLTTSFGALALLVTLISELAKNLGENHKDEVAALAGTFVSIAGAFALIAPAVVTLSLLPEEALDRGLKAVIGIGALFAGLMVAAETFSKGGSNSKAILAAGASIMMIAVAMDMLLPSIVALALLDPDKLTVGITALGATLVILSLVLAGMTAVGGGVVAAAAGLLMLAAAIAILTPALLAFGAAAYPIIKAVVEKVEKTDKKKIDDIAKKLLKLSGVITLVGLALTVFGVGVTALGAGLVVIGAATLIMTPFTVALAGLVKAITNAAKMWPMIKSMLGQLGGVLGNTFLNFMTTIINGAGKIADAIKNVAPKIAEAVVAVIKAILASIATPVPATIELFLQMLDLIFDALLEYMPSLLIKLGEMITIVLNWIDSNIAIWTEKVVSIVLGIIIGALNGLTDRVDEIVAAIFDFLIALNNALAENMKTKGDDLLESIGGVIVEFFKLIGKAAVKYWHFMEDFGGDIIDKIVSGIEEKGGDIIDWFVTLITKDIPQSIKDLADDIWQIGADFIAGVIDGIKGGISAAGDAASGIAKEFLDGLATGWGIASPSKKTEEMGEYLAAGVDKGLSNGSNSTKASARAFGDETMAELNDAMNPDNLDTDPNFDITGKLHIDTTEIENLNTSGLLDNFDISASLGNMASSLNTSSMLASASADSDAQRHADTESNNAMLSALNDNISKLVDSFENGMINIPENATFNIPVIVDGQAMATATAPYLDVINGEKMELERKGVTTR